MAKASDDYVANYARYVSLSARIDSVDSRISDIEAALALLNAKVSAQENSSSSSVADVLEAIASNGLSIGDNWHIAEHGSNLWVENNVIGEDMEAQFSRYVFVSGTNSTL